MKYPIKLSVKTEIIPVLLVLAAFSLGIYFAANFPERVIVHWNFQGVPDGYGSKNFGAFALPALLLGIYILFLLLPVLDPKSERYEQFAKIYHLFKTGIILALFGVFAASGFYNLGVPVPINVVVPVLVGALLIVLGNFMGKIKSNWFVGVRTPWTLASENVWNKTNRFGGYTMVLFGVLIIIVPFLPQKLGLALFAAGAIFATVGTMAYSYWLFKKEKRQISN